MSTVHVEHPSPLGTLTLVATDGVLVGLHFPDLAHAPDTGIGDRDPAALREVRRQLDEYFAGQRTSFDVPLDLHGTDFQRRVWDQLRAIPYGETRSYGEVAEDVGGAETTRAVGLANGRNPMAIIVPCHRVIGADGSLVGYGGGLDRKRWLLDLESGAQTLFGRSAAAQPSRDPH